MNINDIYKRLKNEININDKIYFDNKENVLIINFHEYLELVAKDEYISINNGLTHWHPVGDELLFYIEEIVSGNIIFIQYRSLLRRLLTPWDIKIMYKDKFLKKSNKYLNYRKIRIYSGNEIIKYSK